MKYFFLVLVFIAAPLIANAAVFQFENASYEVGKEEEFVVRVLLEPENETVTTLEAKVTYPEELLELKEIREGNSIIPVWITPPSHDQSSVVFAGLIPGGFSGLIDPIDYPSLKPGEITSLVFKAQQSGIGTLELTGVRYTIDGATKEFASPDTGSRITVLPHTLDQRVEFLDQESPEFIHVSIEDLPSGKHLVFSALDKESGIKMYEVRELGGKWTKATSPHKISYPFIPRLVSVRAHDLSGNIIEEKVALHPGLSFVVLVLLVVLSLFTLKKWITT